MQVTQVKIFQNVNAVNLFLASELGIEFVDLVTDGNEFILIYKIEIDV